MTVRLGIYILRRQETYARFHRLALFLLLSCTLAASAAPLPKGWVPIRWTGGPLEVAWRARTKTLPADAAVREALARWYEPATLSLLEESPANCLLVTWSAPVDTAVEAEQQQLVKVYAEAAHKRGLAVLGLVYATGDPARITANAAAAGLDGLVLEGEFTAEFPAALRKAGSMLIIEITKDAAPWRWRSAAIIAVGGVVPSGRNLSEMGIRGAPSSEPWIESNVWLVRSFGVASGASPMVWISSQPENALEIDYLLAVADAAAGGGRWIVSLEDKFRAQLRAREASAVAAWRRMSAYLKFAESHSAWPALTPYGNVGVVVDRASASSDEYLKLIARRQVPYRLLERSSLNSEALAKLRALVAIELDPPSATERKLLQEFAEEGGVVIAPSSWGGAPRTEPFAEVSTGKGRVIVYRDPDPQSLARDVKEMLSDEELGMVPFNVPSVITFASGGGPGQPLVVQLLNYFDHPVEAITLRVAGKFGSARLETPDSTTLDLPVRQVEARTEVTIPKLLLWGTVSMQ